MPRGEYYKKKTKRPSPAERKRQRTEKMALARIDKGLRTRGAKHAIAILHKLEEEDEEETLELHLRKLVKMGLLEVPPKKLVGSGEAIYSGLWRGFEKRFQDQWWQNQPQPWICHLCHGEIDPNGTHNLAPSIDHSVPWSVSKLQIATDVVCKDGIHWMVALTSDVRAVLQDEQNLEPSHQGCNSRKGGPTNTDSLAPMRIGKCPLHGKCSYPKAQ